MQTTCISTQATLSSTLLLALKCWHGKMFYDNLTGSLGKRDQLDPTLLKMVNPLVIAQFS
jgi:hypothetical protein